MAEVQQKDSGGGGKGKQKKQTLRVDFTPMVDMNMLLITFFMFATTLLKPQTMDINMPAKTNETPPNVKESEAITMLLGADNKLYYYEGMIAEDKSTYDDPEFLKESAYGAEGIRKLLLERNSFAFEQIQELRAQLKSLDITDEQFKERWKEIQDAAKKEKKTPTVMIKPTDQASYKNMVDALDEMLITNIGSYAVTDLSDGDRYLLFMKTNNPVYLTEAQKAQATGGK